VDLEICPVQHSRKCNVDYSLRRKLEGAAAAGLLNVYFSRHWICCSAALIYDPVSQVAGSFDQGVFIGIVQFLSQSLHMRPNSFH
jgi:hypothetical protein